MSNNLDPDQTRRIVEPDLGSYRLQMLPVVDTNIPFSHCWPQLSVISLSKSAHFCNSSSLPLYMLIWFIWLYLVICKAYTHEREIFRIFLHALFAVCWFCSSKLTFLEISFRNTISSVIHFGSRSGSGALIWKWFQAICNCYPLA